jgi:fission process protein 1
MNFLFFTSRRPVANKNVVRAAYGVSWAYVIYDVGKHGVDSHRDGSTPATVGLEMTKRAVFQGLASMALPAFTIHSTVKVFKGVTHCMQRFQRWGPTVAGLAIIPALPYLFDHPVEKAVDWAFSGITSSTD